jgi:hypothetical protein
MMRVYFLAVRYYRTFSGMGVDIFAETKKAVEHGINALIYFNGVSKITLSLHA